MASRDRRSFQSTGCVVMASLFVGVPVAPGCLKLRTSRFRSGAASYARPLRRLDHGE
jgi:hypothetical protein